MVELEYAYPSIPIPFELSVADNSTYVVSVFVHIVLLFPDDTVPNCDPYEFDFFTVNVGAFGGVLS